MLTGKKFFLWLLASTFVISLGAYQIFQKIDNQTIQIWDEASTAKTAIEMLRHNSFFAAYEDGVPSYSDPKPPMSSWIKILSYKLFGINEFSVRFPSALAALLTIVFLWYFGAYTLREPWLGVLFALFLSCTPGFITYHVARTGDPDALLVFFTTLTILFYFKLLTEFPGYQKRNFILFSFFLALTALTKGIAGFAAFIGLGIFTLLEPQGLKLLRNIRFWLSLLIPVLLLAAYYLTREMMDPGFLKAVYQNELSLAVSSPYRETPKHPEFGFYFDYIIRKGFFPLIILVPLVFYCIYPNRIKSAVLCKLVRFALFGAVGFILAMSFFFTKNEWYIAPVYTFLVILAGTGTWFFFRHTGMRLKSAGRSWKNALLALLVLLICFPASIQIFNQNDRGNQVYRLNREGNFIKKVRETLPEVKDFSVVVPYNDRQAKFYALKYEYEEDCKIYLWPTANSIKQTDTVVAICDKAQQSDFQARHRYKVLFNDKYCTLYKVLGHKPKNPIFDSLYYVQKLAGNGNSGFICLSDTSIRFISNGLLQYCADEKQSFIVASKSRPYAISVSFSALNYNRIRTTAWRRADDKKGYVVISIPKHGFYRQSEEVIEQKGIWVKISNEVSVPFDYNGEPVKVYLWNSQGADMHFRDLRVYLF